MSKECRDRRRVVTFLSTLYDAKQTLKLAQTSKVQSLRLSTDDIIYQYNQSVPLRVQISIAITFAPLTATSIAK
jgi:hypothetical protein